MSDHEGQGLDLERWEDASLQGGTTYSYAASDYFNQAGGPNEPSFFTPTQPLHDHRRGYTDHRQNGFGTPLQRHMPQSRTFNGPSRAGPNLPRSAVFKSPTKKGPAQVKFETGQPHDGEYRFVSEWKTHRIHALKIERAATPFHPLIQLHDIMQKRDTWIPDPKDQDQVLLIWGDPSQVEETKAALARWEREVRASYSQPNNIAWVKEKALDGRAEHRARRQSEQNELELALRDASIDFAVEAALLWPRDLDLEQFQTVNSDVLDQFRRKFTCRIDFMPSDVTYVLVSSQSYQEAEKVMSRMLNLIKEFVANRDQLMTFNLVHLPNFELFRDRVGFQDKDPRTLCYLPTLHGDPARDEEEWVTARRATHVGNRKKVKKAVDSALKRLRISQSHVRMRVCFGDLGFTLFQRPANGADTYSFDEFYNMVTKGRTKLHLNGIPVRQGDITDLPDILNGLDAFSECSEFYAAYFDFPSGNTTLRLDTAFYPSGAGETELREHRWVEFGGMVSRLQVSLFNFERPDYQITLDAFPLHTSSAIKGQQMANFQNNISFERPPHGIKSLPRRRVKYPPGQRGLKEVSEIIVMRWRFKNTDGIFELRRKDTFDERGPGPLETRWHALYYYPEWDRLMGDFAHVKPGEDIGWAKSVATFFPESADDGLAFPRGFRNFINEVEEIQDLLAAAISRVATGNGRPTEGNGD